MSIKIGTVIAKNCGSAVSLPSDPSMQFEVSNVQATNCGEGVLVRDRLTTIIESTGLRPDTPHSVFTKLLKAATEAETVDEASSKAAALGIDRWLERGANVSTVASALAQMTPALVAEIGRLITGAG